MKRTQPNAAKYLKIEIAIGEPGVFRRFVVEEYAGEIFYNIE
jgi:hypothetical protein